MHPAALVLLALGPPAADTVAVLPLQVEGDLDGNARKELEQSLREGLARSDFTVAEAPVDVDPGACDATCLEDARQAAGAEHLIRARVTVDARVYLIHVDVIGPQGDVVVSVDGECEICGRSTVAERMASQGAQALRELQLERSTKAERPPPPPSPHNFDGHTEPAPPPSPPPNVRPLQGGGGFALTSGILSLGAGIALLVLHGRPYRSRCSGNDIDYAGRCRFEIDTLAGGLSATLVGAALTATGIGLLVRARNEKKRWAARQRQ